MKIFFVASEVAPFIKTGGLADVASSLPPALAAMGNDVRVILPLYAGIGDQWRSQMTFVKYFYFRLGWRSSYCGLFQLERNGVTYYFVDNETYFKRNGLYGHYDDGERFAYFSRAVIEVPAQIDWSPDVIHANDWETALVPIYLNDFRYMIPQLTKTKSVYTIHNIEYQGRFGRSIMEDVFGLDAGHFNPNYKHGKMEGMVNTGSGVRYDSAAVVTEFVNFTETVPGTSAAISMVAIPGGTFTLGSPKDEPFRQADESPQRKVTISPFFMGELEVTWDQYWAFYNETMSEGRTAPEVVFANNSREDVDAVSGPTPPFGFPDQGWGMGTRPAITMTHYAAVTFCQWLSLKTGRKYRLPTEAEWEYAARGGTSTPYFFEGSPKKYTNEGLMKKIFGIDTTSINGYIIYANNSMDKTQEPARVKANPFGLKNSM